MSKNDPNTEATTTMMTTLAQATPAPFELEHDADLQARVVRRALKTSFEGRVTYRQGDYIEGAAVARNLGRGDIALKLNRYVAPGALMDLELDCLTFRGLPVCMQAEVESCEHDESGRAFVAFVHVHRRALAVH